MQCIVHVRIKYQHYESLKELEYEAESKNIGSLVTATTYHGLTALMIACME